MGAHQLLMNSISLRLVTTLLSTISLFLTPCLGDNNDKLEGFVSCLTDHNINFTTYSDHRNYNKLLYSSMYNLRFYGSSVPKPEAIIVPSSKEQLVKTVLCCKKESVEIRVRCGGHSYEGTSYVATDGYPFVIIEMKNFDKISVDIERRSVWIGGGATLGQIYLAISRVTDEYTIPAGTCPTVGVGGHISGGGFGHLARKYGLAADHVVDALLIDAEGRELDREAMGEEVFWAIRGGGGGIWGIVLEWKMKLVAIPKVMTAFTVIRSQSKHDVASLFHKWQYVAPKLENGFFLVASIVLVPGKGGNDITIAFKGTYLGPVRDAVSTLESLFPELGIKTENCKEMSWIEAILDSAGLPNGTLSDLENRYLGNKQYFKAKYDYVRTPIPIHAIKTALKILENQPKGILFAEPLGGLMDEIVSNAIPFPHRRGTLYGLQYEAQWKEEDNGKSKEYTQWVRKIYKAMTPYVSKSPRASYVNCMDLDLGTVKDNSSDEVEAARVWGKKYFLQNYDKLVRAKTLIDPHNVFRNQQGIPPASI